MLKRPAASSVSLDASRLCRLKVQTAPDTERLQFTLLLPEATGPRLLRRLLDVLEVTLDGKPVPLAFQHSHRAEGNCLLPRREGILRVSVAGQVMAEASVHRSGVGEFKTLLPPLTISELRMMGEFDSVTPYRRQPGISGEGLVFSDFHTHSSGELPGRDLIQIAAGHRLAYPLRLLRELGFQEKDLPAPLPHKVARVIFPPMQDEERHLPAEEEAVPVAALTNAARKKLAAAMDAPFDRQCTFAYMERTCYRFRYPLAKQPELLVPTLMKIGENYARQGIRYAEITMAGIEKPENLRAIHDAVPRVKQKYGVDLRFLVGIPRTMDRAHLHPLLEKTKILAESPYIMGADIIGYETNKTSHLMEELESLAKWIRSGPHKEFTLRVHAGENAKNPDNVFEVLKLADKHKVRVRVGHALHGLDAKSLDLAAKLATQQRVVLEFNPDSNIALNNMDRLEQVPLAACRQKGIDYVLGTDGSGIYGTSALQLALAAQAGLMTTEDQAWLRQAQERLITRQLAYGAQKEKVWQDGLEGLLARCAAVPPTPNTPARRQLFIQPERLSVQLVKQAQHGSAFGALTPVVLAGASGSSWARMSPESQRETAVAVDLMAHLLDPAKVLFVHGRGKERGIVAELARALKPRQGPPFSVLGMITEEHWQELIGERSMAPHITHAELISRGFLYVPEALVRLAKERQGLVVAAGGAAFTRDVVLYARQAGLPVVLLECAEGASRAKAEVLPELAAADARELARALYRRRPDLFREPLTAPALEQAYEESMARQLHQSSGRRGEITL